MKDLKKREGESLSKHTKRLIDYKFKDKLDFDYVEIYDELLGIKISSTEARKRLSGLRDYFEKLNEEGMFCIENNEILKEIEEKTLELQIEKKMMQDQRRELKKYVDSQARFKHLMETMKECVKELNEVEPIRYNKFKGINDLKMRNNEAVLICSDWHIGAKFDNALASYNYEIAEKRVESLLATTIDYCNMNKVKTLHVELLGDMISGLIHISSKVEAEEDAMSQLMRLLKILENFLWELADKIPQVNVYTAIGNHSRLCPNIKDNQEGENFERMIPFYLKNRFEGKVENIDIRDGANIDDCIVAYEVLGTKIFGVHGDLDKPNDVVNSMINMFKIFPDEVHMGHYHTDMEKTEYDMSVIVNGSLQGTDTFAKKIRKSGSPLQKLLIYNNEGQICEYKIRLN